MRYFYNPVPVYVVGMDLLFLLLFTPTPYMRYIPSAGDGFPRWIAIVTLISTQVLNNIKSRLHNNLTHHPIKLRHIMSVRSGYDYRQRDATLVYQYMPLASIFFPDPSDFFPLLPAPAEPLPLHRLCSARSRLYPPSHHIRQGPLATASKKDLPSTISGNTCVQNWDSHTAPSARPSIGSQFSVRTQSPQIPSSGQSAFSQRQLRDKLAHDRDAGGNRPGAA